MGDRQLQIVKYEFTLDEWKTHVLHRIWCREDGCADFSHTYVWAIDAGRVYVDGLPAQTICNWIDDETFEVLLGNMIRARDPLRGVKMPMLTGQQISDLGDKRFSVDGQTSEEDRS